MISSVVENRTCSLNNLVSNIYNTHTPNLKHEVNHKPNLKHEVNHKPNFKDEVNHNFLPSNSQ